LTCSDKKGSEASPGERFFLAMSVYHVYIYNMNSRDIIKKLKQDGFEHTHTKGDHWKFRKNNRTVIVPHPKKDLPIGTARNIYRKAGWKWR
jgi:predicted RNA binding protein YcfA (HicA-like mRNA interferase family)